MKFYLEITLLPNPEVGRHFLWSKVFQQIHLGLVEMQDEQQRVPIGVSFPEYIVGEKYSILGGKCRLFAKDEAMLDRFNAAKWLERLSDYVHCTSIRPVPGTLTGHAVYQRQQAKSNPERLARRYAKRHQVDADSALSDLVMLDESRAPTSAAYKMQFRYSELSQHPITTPFIRMNSLSSEHSFRLWIKKSLVAEPFVAGFSTYGLGLKDKNDTKDRRASVPEF